MTSDALYKAIAVLVIIFSAAGVYLRYEDTRPCAHPVEYRIGAFDTRFRISESDLVDDLATAADIWNTAAGKKLITFSLTSGVPVNLVYDARQQNSNLGTSLSSSDEDLAAQKARIDALTAQYERSRSAADRAQLQALIATYNAQVSAHNAGISTYNANAGRIEEGEYDGTGEAPVINLYEFSTKTEFVRLAAHEFGHALGLDHDEGADSIMYPLNKSYSLSLSSQDLAALKALCKFE